MGQLVLRNLAQMQIDSATSSIELRSTPSLFLVAEGSGSRRRHLISLLGVDEELSSRVISICHDAHDPRLPPAAPRRVEPLSCGDACDAIRSVSRGDQGIASIFLDVSCLGRQHIGDLFSAVKQLAETGPVDLHIGYSLARFVKPPPLWSTAIRRIAPVNNDFAGWTATPEKPLELVIALGYERGKATGAAEYLEPGETWLYVPVSPEQKYLSEVERCNRGLLQERRSHRLDYDVLSPVDTYHSLLSLVRGMKNVARPVLLPFGPKIFFGLSLLVALAIDEVAVWFVDGENTSATDSAQPSSHAVIMSCFIERSNEPICLSPGW